jgi:hypothetical protein
MIDAQVLRITGKDSIMLTKPWPTSFVPKNRPHARMTGMPVLSRREWLDEMALAAAHDVAERNEAIRCGGLTQTYTELFYQNRADFTAFNTSSSEGSIITSSVGDQPAIPALYFAGRERRSILIEASGIIGTTSTPTIIFQVRLGTTAGGSYLSGTSVGVTAAITTSSGVSNKLWRLRLQLTCNTPGIGTGNATLSGAGTVWSGGGFASPFEYAIEPTTPDTATWTSTIDAGLTQYLNLSATFSASSASNTITTKNLSVWGLN